MTFSTSDLGLMLMVLTILVTAPIVGVRLTVGRRESSNRRH